MKHILLLSALFLALTLSAQDYPIQPVPFTDVKLTDSFWAPRIEKNHKVTIPIALQYCYNTGRVDNFLVAGGWKKGKFAGEYPFDDSDVFKIIEGASFSLQTFPDKEMEGHLDALIYYIGKAQEPDGYLFTNRTINPDSLHAWVGKKRWEKDPDLSHELYNLGHLYEAATAHYQATGKRNLLDIAIKSANLVCNDFGPGKLDLAPGHQVIEMGLVKLYRATGNKKYLDLAKFFLECRGRGSNAKLGSYAQNHAPAAEQVTAEGHAVRAMYQYAAMADVTALMGGYAQAMEKIWDDIVYKKYYITGGIGAAGGHEGFGTDYDLPNMSAYNETCASIGEIFWNHRLFLLNGDAKFYDILERTLYNGMISGVSVSADRFFYPNPLESKGQHARSAWFGCACCPSNVCRFIPSIPGYIYAKKDNRLYVNLFMQSETEVALSSGKVKLQQTTDYPWKGDIAISVSPASPGNFQMAIRIPGWAVNRPVPGDLYRYAESAPEPFTLTVNNQKVQYTMEAGYAIVDRAWKVGDKIALSFAMPIRKVLAHDKVLADKGKMAIERGPVVYCLEWADQSDKKVLNRMVPQKTKLTSQFRPDLLGGVEVITGQAVVLSEDADKKMREEQVSFTAIPYYAWANRGNGEMMVWIPFEKGAAKPMKLPTLASKSKVTASHRAGSLDAIKDQELPKNSNDKDISYYHWWPKNSSTEWIRYDFEAPAKVSKCQIYWYDDKPFGGCALPKSWKIYYLNKSGQFTEVKALSAYPSEKDKLNEISFEPVETQSLKLEVVLPDRDAAGLYEWIVK